MKLALSFMAALLAATAQAADPVFIDELMDSSLPVLQRQFAGLRKDGCYKLGEGPFLMITMGRDQKPSRVAVATDLPCRRAEPGPEIEVRHRGGVVLGDSTVVVVGKLGRPDASADPEGPMRKLGDAEYFYVCRVSDGCSRHTSVFIRAGIVSGIAEWNSE